MAYTKKTAEEKKAEIKTLIEDTERKINDYFESPESIKKYLSFMSKFYNYSLNNSILIENQFSGAVGVGSYAFWKKEGFKVSKGEKGIKILVPQISKDNFKNEEGEIKLLESATKEEIKKIENKDLDIKKGRIHFGQGYIFDISQTNAKIQDLPKIFPNRWLEGDVKNYNALYKGMEKIAENLGVKIVEVKQELGVAKGVSYTNKKEVALNPRNTELQNVKTLPHELTHAKLHTMENLDKYQTYEKELQAELTAYTVCSHFGINTGEYSLKYLHDWNKNRTLNDKKQLLKEVRETSVEYIETLEETLVVEKNIEKNQYQNENKIYESTQVTKLDTTKEIVHIYQIDDEPKKCFLGHKINNKVKELGVIGTLEIVKKEFNDFMEYKEKQNIKLGKSKKIVQEISLDKDNELSL